MNTKSFLFGCLVTAGLFLIAGFASESPQEPSYQVHGDRGVFCILNTRNGDYSMVLPSGDPVGRIRNFAEEREHSGLPAPESPEAPEAPN